MSVWVEIAKGIFKIIRDTGTSFKTITPGGSERLLDQNKDVVRTIDSRKIIRHYDTESGKRIK